MPKYINADEMLSDESEAYMRAQTKISDIETYIINYLVHAKIQRRLHDAPAADVVEAVRCKDCKFYIPDAEYCGVMGFCEPNEFCSRGEIKKQCRDTLMQMN